MTGDPAEPEAAGPDEHGWTVRLAASAIRGLDAVPSRVTPAIIEFLFGPLADNPHRVGKPLRDDLAGSFAARRGSYRVLYDINDDERVVRVFRVASRASAYRRR